MSRNGRRNFIPAGFSIRRLLLQGARAAHGSSPIGQSRGLRSCDVEKGNLKNDKKFVVGESSTSSKNGNNAEAASQNSSTSQILRQNSQQYLQEQSSSSTGTVNGADTNNTVNNTISASSSATVSQQQNSENSQTNICPICLVSLSPQLFFTLVTCSHKACRMCLERYLKNEINESRTDIACPQCSEAMHPSNIEALLKEFPEIINKYEDFMVRRFLLADPDSRWCPAPDCSYAVIASGCASCPRLRCQRPGCGLHFCYHCKAEWHPDQTCDAARASRQSPTRAPSGSTSQDSQHRDDIKPCPRCQVLIVKMDDGSCNHMVCSVCGSEFCWLCMKEISDLHYLSPSGCTFWGKKPWSRKKKLLWQLGILVGAPVGIALVAGIAVPAMIIGIPVWVGKKIYARYKTSTKHKRNCAVLGGVATSILISPVLAGLAVAIGVPILLFYVYGVVPVSLCRAGCGVSTTRDGFKFDFDEEVDNNLRNQGDGASVDAVSRIGATSIGEVSLSVASGSHVGVSAGHNATVHAFNNRESTTALAGSITGHRLEVQADISSSETASAVTCVSEKSGNTLNDTASTRALAGSILSSKQHLDSSNVSEDGISEKVRFDNTISYITEIKKENIDVLPNQSDQEFSADKTSIGSSHSFRSSERSFRDDVADTSTSSTTATTSMITLGSTKRFAFGSRIPKLNAATHKTLSLDRETTAVTDNIPENVSLEQEAEEEEERDSKNLIKETQQYKLCGNTVTGIIDRNVLSSTSVIDLSTTKKQNQQQQSDKTMTKSSNMSKSSVLRNLFFSSQQHQPENIKNNDLLIAGTDATSPTINSIRNEYAGTSE